MPLDALTLNVIVQELQTSLRGCRITKIHQPENDEISLVLHGNANLRLVLSANPTLPRIHLTGTVKENPYNAPSFCMLLRKHLLNGTIQDVSQTPLERAVDLTVQTKNDFGYLQTKHLIAEITGKSANLILTDERYVIIDTLKHLPMDVSSKRNLLAGFPYPALTQSGRFAPWDDALKERILSAEPDQAVAVLRASVQGAAAQSVTEMAGSFTTSAELWQNVQTFTERLRHPQPNVTLKEDGTFLDFYPFDYRTIPYQKRFFATLNEALDAYYAARDTAFRFRDHAHGVATVVKNAVARAEKRLGIQMQALEDCKNYDTLRETGELILANLYLIPRQANEITVDDYYRGGTRTIPLDPTLSPQQNAQKYFKKYAKQKSTVEHTLTLTEETKSLLDYLQTVQISLKYSTSPADLEQIKQELAQAGILKTKQKRQAGKTKEIPNKPLHYLVGGYDVFVGKNNLQNEYVTFRLADGNDLWFHTKHVHSAHVLLKGSDVPNEVLQTTAEITAFFSQTDTKTEVDYTQKKHVKKPGGAKPGFVTYTNYETCYVAPNEHRELLAP